MAYAHSLEGEPPEKWEPLEEHLNKVAGRAAEFCEAFGAAEWGRLAGLWHDLGKYSAEFQNYISRTADPDAGENEMAPGRVDHSTFGAQHASRAIAGAAGQILAFCIAGHHAGLTDATTGDGSTQRSTLEMRLKAGPPRIPEVVLPAKFPPPPNLSLSFPRPSEPELGFALAFFTRMLFSALIDADRTATEAFCNPTQSVERNQPKPTLADLRPVLDHFLTRKQQEAPATPVNAIRARVLSECLEAAALPPGFFSLDVPTGGGKTLASLAFALHHAAGHPSLRRVVVAIPFTSIIEQTADQYRKALEPFSARAVLEHQSNLNPRHDTRDNKLASENWNAPIIVTTNVQLYESLFAAGTTPARKLHRLAHSIIILDEAQTMPVDLLKPTLAALKELVARYGCTVVLCTATQPALEFRAGEFEIGIPKVKHIISDPSAVHSSLKRVEIVDEGKLDDVELAARLADERAVLCVVNTKAHAAKLYDGIVAQRGDATGCYHLSTFMCPQHRREALAEIRHRLKNRDSCRVISTQLIEAGVDVDFPVVYRAPAGFDSIAQAAGRCNREGHLVENGQTVPGRVYIFDTDQRPPPGMLRNAAQVAAELSSSYPDPLAPAAIETYFKLLYWSRQHEWDKHEVMPCFDYNRATERVPLFKFRTAAEAYRIIREEQTPILVSYDGTAKRMIDHLLAGRPVDYGFFREAQRYTVSVRDDLLSKLADNRNLVPHEAGLWVLANEDAYSKKKGLLPNVAGLDPAILFG